MPAQSALCGRLNCRRDGHYFAASAFTRQTVRKESLAKSLLARARFGRSPCAPRAVVASVAAPAWPAPRLRRPGSPTRSTSRSSKGALKFVAPEIGHPGRRTGNRQRHQPETGRPAHLLAGDQGLVAEDQAGPEELLHAEAHLPRRSPSGTAFNPKTEEDHDQPGQGRPEGWSTMGSTSQEGRLLVHRLKKGALVHAAGDRDPRPARRSTSCARSTPGCTARSRSCRPAASGTSGQSSSPPRLGRRAFLGALGGGALARPAAAAGAGLAGCCRSPRTRRGRSAAVPFRARLPIPRELTDAQIEIPIREAEAQILPGRKTRLWTYGGTFPGPTVRRPAGQRTKVTFHHELPAKAGELLGPPARRPQPHPVRRPARRPDQVPAALLLLPHPRGLSPRAVGQRPADRARAGGKPTSTT